MRMISAGASLATILFTAGMPLSAWPQKLSLAMNNDTNQIIAETQAFAAAWSSADARAAAGFFTEDGVRIGAFGDVQRGRAEIEAAYDRLLHQTMPGAGLTQEPGEVRMLSPEFAIWQGGIEITPEGADAPISGHVVQLMRKVDGRWLILESHPKLYPSNTTAPSAQRADTHATAETQQQELRMQAEVVGEGPPLVLIGGGLTGWKSWEPHAEQLAAERTVARLQLLSVQYGLEKRPLPDGYSVRTESAALAAVLDSLGWREPVDLVAWSYGGLVTLDFALNHPERVRTLTLIEPPAVWMLPDRGRNEADVQEMLALAESIADDVTDADLERFIRTAGLCPPGMSPQELPQWPVWMEHRRSLRNTRSALNHLDDPSRVRAFDRPVLLVTGTGTAPFLRRVHDGLAANFPVAHTAEMPAGHAPQLVSMERFLAELARFHAAAADYSIRN